MTRHDLVVDLTAWLTRPAAEHGPPVSRALVLHGVAGAGTTTFLANQHASLLELAPPGAVVVVDDVHALTAAQRGELVVRVARATTACAVLGGRRSELLERELAAAGVEVRAHELGPLGHEEARALLVQLGVPRWSIHARHAVERSGGLPRALVDEAFASLDLSGLVLHHARVSGPRIDQLLDVRLRGGDSQLRRLVAACGRLIEQTPGRAESTGLVDAHLVVAELALVRGELETAVQHGELAALGAPHEAATDLRRRGAAVAAAARVARGEPEAAVSLRALTAAAAARPGASELTAVLHHLAALGHLLAGEPALAVEAADAAIARADAAGATALGLGARMTMVRSLHAIGDQRGALALARELEQVARHLRLRPLLAEAITAQVRALVATGERAEALERSTIALDLATRSDLDATVELELRRAVADAQRAPDADDRPSSPWSRPRTHRGAPTDLGVLTTREREVAQYVAGGMTSPEIARALHLSPRTVEHHVASILRKLELGSRRELVLGRTL